MLVTASFTVPKVRAKMSIKRQMKESVTYRQVSIIQPLKRKKSSAQDKMDRLEDTATEI